MQDQLESIRKDFDSATERVRKFQSRFSPDEWQRKPSPEGWSAIECIQHLNLTSQLFIPRLTEAIAKADKLTAPKTFHLDLIGWLLVKVLGSRGRLSKSKTSSAFVPPTEHDISSTLTQFSEDQNALTGLLDQAKNKAIDKIKVQSAFRESVHYNIFSAFRILTVHEMRHLDQAERAVRGE